MPETANHFPEIKKALNRCFNGKRAQVLWEKSGSIDLRLCLDIANDYTVSGTCVSTIRIDGREYSCVSRISGYFNKSSNSLRYHVTEHTLKDELPYDLVWLKGNGDATLTMLKDNDHPGHFILKGQDYDGSRMELGDYR